MKDYYKILGVGEEANEEEIRARWIELTKHYHPDWGQEGGAEERLKEVNEAYQVLKDPATRLEYDLERIVKRSLRKASLRKEGRVKKRKMVFASAIALFSLLFLWAGVKWFSMPKSHPPEVIHPIDRSSEKEGEHPASPFRTEIRIRVGEEKIFQRKEGEGLSESRTKITFPPAAQLQTPIIKESKEEKTPPVQREEEQTPPIALVREVPSEAPVESPSPPTVSPVPVEREPRPDEKPKEIPPPVAEPSLPPVKEAKEVTKEPPAKIEKEILKEVPKESPKENQKESVRVPGPAVSPQDLPPAPSKPAAIEPQTAQTAKTASLTEKQAFLTPPLVKEEEVKQFFSNYIDRYDRRDIEGFLSLFSQRALQNQKDRFEEIKRIYTLFFNQSQELKYRLGRMDIQVHPDRAEVRGRYRIDQTLKRRGEARRWQGELRTVLVKEEGSLKIISLDYQHDPSP